MIIYHKYMFGKEITIFDTDEYIKIIWDSLRKPILLIRNKRNCFECLDRNLTWDGYPKIRLNGKNYRLNRFLYMLYHDTEDLGDKIVLHACDNRLCCYPGHLSLGTKWDNMCDMIRKDRPTPIKVKLTKYDVVNIVKSPLSTKELAFVYDVSYATIANIRNGKTWKNVLPPF